MLDQEFAAIVEVMKALDPLDGRTRVRVLSFAMDRLGIAELAIWMNQYGKLDQPH